MNEEEKKALFGDIEKLLNNCKELSKEMNAMDDGKNFLINEYKTNKRWFKDEPGKVTIEDVIKASFEFGWSSRKQYDYEQSNKDKIA